MTNKAGINPVTIRGLALQLSRNLSILVEVSENETNRDNLLLLFQKRRAVLIYSTMEEEEEG